MNSHQAEQKRILFATDFSVPAQRAYFYALKLASVFNARLIILTVLKTVPWVRHSQHLHSRQTGALLELGKLARLAEEADRSLTPMLVFGSPSACISEIADEVGAALIVMGTHGRSGWNRLELGSTAQAVLREASCPVLTVRASETNGTSGPHTTIRLKSVLVPFDFSKPSQDAFTYAMRIAKHLDLSVRLLHIRELDVPGPVRATSRPAREEMASQKRLRKRLQRRVLRLRYQKIQAESVIKVGTPREVILEEAKDANAHMIVMGTRGRRGVKRLVLGSVAKHVVSNAGCPVLTVKTPL